MNILYDNIIFSLQKSGGISTYWGELIKRLILSDNNISFYDRYDSNENIVRKNLHFKNQVVNYSSIPLIVDRFLDVKVKSKDELLLFHSSYNRVCSNKDRNIRVVTTIHDFIHEKFYNGYRSFVLSKQKQNAINNSDHIIVVSNSTKNDLLEYYPEIREDKISVVYNGVSDLFSQVFPVNFSFVQKEFLLFVGSRATYKNFKNLVKVMSKISDFKLVIVGPSLCRDEVIYLNSYLSENWDFHESISLHKLNLLYSSAFAFVYPSLYEGFGIPVLEAMKSGCPVIALNNSSLPEVCGDAAVLIENLDVSELNSALSYVATNRENIVQRGLIQASFFSWDKCYIDTMEVYKRLYL